MVLQDIPSEAAVLQVISKAAALKNLPKITGKDLWWSSLSVKLEIVTLQ